MSRIVSERVEVFKIHLIDDAPPYDRLIGEIAANDDGTWRSTTARLGLETNDVFNQQAALTRLLLLYGDELDTERGRALDAHRRHTALLAAVQR